MRDVPGVMTSRWRSGDYIGEARPITRVTLQQGLVTLYEKGINTFSSIIFDNPNEPVEFTAVKDSKWDRGIDADTATANLTLWNTADLGVGELPFDPDELDLPGIFTYVLDEAKFGRLPNEMAQLLVPDNIIRTYEGYGFDAGLAPEHDPNLVISGTWLIDDVVYGMDGTISVAARDFARILIDQVAYKPVIPDEHYPLRFTATGGSGGFLPPYTNLGIEDVTGYSTIGYAGPTTAPGLTIVEERDGEVEFAITPPPVAPAELALPAERMSADVFRTSSGYYVRFPPYDDGVDYFRGEEWYDANGPGQVNAAIFLWGAATTVEQVNIGPIVSSLAELFGGASELERYIPAYAPIGYTVYVYDRIQPLRLPFDATGFTLSGMMNGNIYAVSVAAVWQHFESSAKQTGDLSQPRALVRPHETGGPNVTPDTQGVVPVVGNPAQLDVSWNHDAGSTSVEWTIIQFQSFGEAGDFRRVYTRTANTSGTTTVQIPAAPGDDNEYAYLVYGEAGGLVGKGYLLHAVTSQSNYYRPLPGGMPPPFDSGGALREPDQVIPRDTVPIPIDVRSTSTIDEGAMDGQALLNEINLARLAVDGEMAQYWVSRVQGSRNDQVWVEFEVPNVTLAMVRVFTWQTSYMAYISVYAEGQWRAHDTGNVVPGGGIPYMTASGLPEEGPNDFFLQVPVTGVTRIRVTLTNLREVAGGFQGGLRQVEARVPLNEINRSEDPDDLTTEARVVGGAGDNPHTYFDYTDIVKLLCAWGGFFWPQDGTVMASDGIETVFNFGQAPFNLGDNIDPTLGADSGRVWGDFEIAGTAGVADLPVSQFDKKPLMDGINYIRNILGFCFYVDEEGAIVWRQVNIFRVGNYILTRSTQPGFTLERVVIDERVSLMDFQPTVSSRNVREKIYVATTDGAHGAVVDGFNPNPIGLRRVAGWTDQHFKTEIECLLMAQMIAIRQMFTYRVTRVTIPGYPRIQPNDQVQIRERITQEDYLHFVSNVSSSMDHVSGRWTYDLTTHWLGTDPEDGIWAIDIEQLAEELGDALDNQAQAAGLGHYVRPRP